MKTMKKIASLLLALAMIFALATTAFATGDTGDVTTLTKKDSITVTSAKSGETYKLYKLFDLKVNDEINPTAYSYTINKDWDAFFTGSGAGEAYITVNDKGYVTAISDAAALAKAAAAWTSKPGETRIQKASGESVTFTGLEDGYWLITSTLGTFAMTETTPDKENVTVNEKNHENSIDKEVKEDSTSAFGETNDAQVGDTVEFKSIVKIVKGTRNVVVHDKMDAGLTYTASSVGIAGLTKDTDYTVNENPADGDTFDITFIQSWIDGLDFGNDGFKEYVITYTAVLNDKAVVKNDDGVAIVDQNNKTHVSFGDSSKSTEETTTTTTHKFSVFKHATGSTENLAGAKFKLKKGTTVLKLIQLDDNNYRIANGDETGSVEIFTTVKNGDIVIWGVDADEDYKLEETEAPVGYNKLTEEVSVEVDAGNATKIDVANNSGTELPSTGGMGTTLFYVLGGILVAVAVVLLVTKKRMASNN